MKISQTTWALPIVNELNELSSGKSNFFYSAALKKNINVQFRIIVALGDQPERRQINYLMNGNSLYGARYGYACKIGDLKSILPSCTKCEKAIRHNELNKSISCDKCLRWNIMSNVSLCGTQPPKYYPIQKQNDDGKLYPIELNWKILLKVLKTFVKGKKGQLCYCAKCLHFHVQ